MTSELIFIQEITHYISIGMPKNDIIKILITRKNEVIKQLSLNGVTTRTFRFSGLYNKDKFTKLITAPNRETAIAYFETENPHLTWRTSTELD
jgi:hypothetical protein